MRKGKRQEVALALGALLLLIAVFIICVTINGQWTPDIVATKVIQVVCGSFVLVIGVHIFAWGVSDKAGTATDKFLRYIWDRFLKALGR